MPCERLFSGTKQIADDRRTRLGSKVFEELVIMKSAWGPQLYNFAAWNTAQVEETSHFDYEQMLLKKVDCLEWDKEMTLISTCTGV